VQCLVHSAQSHLNRRGLKNFADSVFGFRQNGPNCGGLAKGERQRHSMGAQNVAGNANQG